MSDVTFIATGARAGETFRAGCHAIVRGELILSTEDAAKAARGLANFSVYPDGVEPEPAPPEPARDLTGRALDPDVRAAEEKMSWPKLGGERRRGRDMATHDTPPWE